MPLTTPKPSLSCLSLYLAALTLLAGCSASRMAVPIVPGITPYRIDIQQGNIVTQEMLDKLEPGMSRNQVRFVLGTPLIVDPFRTDRWDYVYRMNKRGDLVEHRQLKVFFKDDRLERFEGEVVAETKLADKPAAMAEAKPIAKPLAAAKPEPKAGLAKPVAKPQPVKPIDPVAQPEPTKPAPPLAEVPRDTAQPQLRLATTQGEPATPSEKAAAAAAPKPKPPESLESVPLPRIEVPPEPPAVAGDQPPAGAADRRVPEVKPGAVRREDTPPGSAPAPFETPRTVPAQTPSAAPAPVVAEKPAEKPAVKPAVKPEPAVVSKPAEKPASSGFFGRLMDGLRNPAPPKGSFGGEREARPGEPPPPFVDPAK